MLSFQQNTSKLNDRMSACSHVGRNQYLTLFSLKWILTTFIQRIFKITDTLINRHHSVWDQLDQDTMNSRGERMMSETMKQSVLLFDHGDNKYPGCSNVFALLVLCVCLLNTPTVVAEKNLNFQNPPGKLVPIGTHRLHLYCKGTGTPVVLIDSGMGSFSMEWKKIHDTLSQDVKTCLYDRAGYGWSDIGPFPRTTKQISDELYFLTEAAKLEGPMILVGHSFGGYTMQYFASDHPDKVAGIVLVDSSHADQFKRMDLKPVPKHVEHHKKIMRQTMSWPVLHRNYPDEVKRLALRMLTNSKSHITRLNEQYYFRESAEQVARINNRIPNVPLVVITRGKRVWPVGERGDKQEHAWEEMQIELSYLTTLSIQVVARNSGHSIHLDQPELVGSVILDTVSAARKIAYKHYDGRKQIHAMKSPWQTDSLLEYYFDYTVQGAYVYQSNNTLYYDPTAYDVNYH